MHNFAIDTIQVLKREFWFQNKIYITYCSPEFSSISPWSKHSFASFSTCEDSSSAWLSESLIKENACSTELQSLTPEYWWWFSSDEIYYMRPLIRIIINN